MELLSKLFGDAVMVRLMRFFLFHPDSSFSNKQLAENVGSQTRNVSGPLSWLKAAGVIKKLSKGWTLDTNFPHMISLRELLIGNMVADVPIVDKVSKSGATKLVIASGLFVEGGDESRIDLLIVADRMNEKKLERAMDDIEANCGTEIRYVGLSTKEFKYRMDMNDKLVRDVLDYPHRKLVNKLGL